MPTFDVSSTPSSTTCSSVPAISLDGPKGVGKPATAGQRATTVYRLDDPGTPEVVRADSDRLTSGRPPILVDEWQRHPAAWDVVRRAVDREPGPGRFLLTGSATPSEKPTHSGAGRIVRLRVRTGSRALLRPDHGRGAERAHGRRVHEMEGVRQDRNRAVAEGEARV